MEREALRQEVDAAGTTNARGRVRLTICGSKSGTFLVRSAGAVPTGSITIHVKHAPPMAPARVSVGSPAGGQLAVSWTRPPYAGGATVTSYRVTATTSGQSSRFYIVRGAQLAKGLTYTFTGLARAKIWHVSVQAVTRYGIGDPATGSTHVI